MKINIENYVNEKTGSRKLGKAKKILTKQISNQLQNISFSDLIKDDYFLGKFGKELYPKNKEILEHIWGMERNFDTFIYVGGIGSGKTSISGINIWMMVFRNISMVDEPQKYYKLMANSVIAFCCMSRTAELAKKVTFLDMLKYFDVPVFYDYFPPQINIKEIMDNPKRLPAELRFPRRLTIFPGTGSALSLLGYNLHSAIVDEVNRITTRQEMHSDLAEESTPAEEAVNAIYTRQHSRFMKKGGGTQGLLSIVSSPWSLSDYTRKRITEEILLGDQSNVYWVWMSIPEVKSDHPDNLFSGEVFYFDVNRMKIIDEWQSDVAFSCTCCNKKTKKGWIFPTGNMNVKMCSIECYKEMKATDIEIIKNI